MKFNLTLVEKEEIVSLYGSNVKILNKAEFILNELDIINDEEDFYEVLCLIAFEYENMKDMKLNQSAFARRNLSEVIAAAILEKYGPFNNMTPQQGHKAKVFVNKFYKEEQ